METTDAPHDLGCNDLLPAAGIPAHPEGRPAAAVTASENPAPWQDYQTVFTNAKAGMDSVDKAYVQKVVYEMSKDSAHFRNEQRKQAQVDARIAQLRARSDAITPAELAAATRSVDARIASLESRRDLTRTWLHADMDCFYAAVHERERPELKRVPLAVGGMGMISTTNYVARKYGVRSAMPGFIGKRLCPQLVFIRPDFHKYTAVAEEVRAVLRHLDPDFESGGLDEAYLDITDFCVRTGCSGEEAAEELRRRVRETCGGLTCSCGVAPNKMLAKICSDINKPDGQYVLPPSRTAILSFLDTLPTRKIPCIGKVTEQLLRGVLGVADCGQLLGPQRGRLPLLFSDTAAGFFIEAALGLAATRHAPKADTQQEPGRKGISCERTFRNMSDPRQQEAMARQLVESLAADLATEELEGRNLTLKLKLSTFEVRTRAATLPRHVRTATDMLPHVLRLLRAEGPLELRLMGVRMAALCKVNSACRSPLARLLGLGRHNRQLHQPGTAGAQGSGATAAAVDATSTSSGEAAVAGAAAEAATADSTHRSLLPPQRQPASAPPPCEVGGGIGSISPDALCCGLANAAFSAAAAASRHAPVAARTSEPGASQPGRGWGSDQVGVISDSRGVGGIEAWSYALHDEQDEHKYDGLGEQMLLDVDYEHGEQKDDGGELLGDLNPGWGCGGVGADPWVGLCEDGDTPAVPPPHPRPKRARLDADGPGPSSMVAAAATALAADSTAKQQALHWASAADAGTACSCGNTVAPAQPAIGRRYNGHAAGASLGQGVIHLAGPGLSQRVTPCGTEVWTAHHTATETAAITVAEGARDGSIPRPQGAPTGDGGGGGTAPKGAGEARHKCGGAGAESSAAPATASAAATTPAAAALWSCRVCTFARNRKQLLRCEVCDCLRGSTQPQPEQQQRQHPQQGRRGSAGTGEPGAAGSCAVSVERGGGTGGGGAAAGRQPAGGRIAGSSGGQAHAHSHSHPNPHLQQLAGQRPLEKLWAAAAKNTSNTKGALAGGAAYGAARPPAPPSAVGVAALSFSSVPSSAASTRSCPQCGAAVAVGRWVEHQDWHLALRLSREGIA